MSGAAKQNPDLLTVLFSTLLFLSPLLYADSLFQPSDLPRYFATALAGPLALGWLALHGVPIRWSNATALAVLLFGWGALTLVWTPDRGGAWVLWMQWLSAGLCALAIAQQARSTAFVRAVVTASIAGAALTALIGTLENLGMPSPYRDMMVGGATFYVKNHAALYLDAIAPVAVGAVFAARDGRARWFFGVASGLIIGYLMMSRTRGSWVAMAVVAMVAMWACRHYRWPWREAVRAARGPLFAGLCLALAIAAWPGEMAKVWSRPVQGDSVVDESSSIRLSFYANTLSMVADHPLAGVGLNGWPQRFRDHYQAPRRLTAFPDSQEQRTHNDPLQFIVELGIPAGLLVMALLTWPLVRVRSLARATESATGERTLLIAMGFGLLATLTHSLLDFPLHKPSSLLQYAAWSGLILGSGGAARELAKPIGRAAVVALSALLLVIAIRDHLRFFAGSELTQASIGVFNQPPFPATPCPIGVSRVDEAVKLFPEYFAAHIQRVKVHARCSSDETIISVMTEELAANPTDAAARLARGRAWLRQRRFDRAEADFRAVIARFDYDYRAWDALVELYQATGNEPAAREAAARAVALNAFRPRQQSAGSIKIDPAPAPHAKP